MLVEFETFAFCMLSVSDGLVWFYDSVNVTELSAIYRGNLIYILE